MKVSEQQITAQKDYACVLGLRLEDLIRFNTGEDVKIEYVTILQALSDEGLRLTYVGEKKDIAGVALVNAICNDYEVPIRQPHQVNIFTVWIKKIVGVDETRALEIHNYIDDNNLIEWANMDSLIWTEDMDMQFRRAIEQAIDGLNNREKK